MLLIVDELNRVCIFVQPAARNRRASRGNSTNKPVLRQNHCAWLHNRSFQLGASYREVLPLAIVLLVVALRPQLEAVEELE